MAARAARGRSAPRGPVWRSTLPTEDGQARRGRFPTASHPRLMDRFGGGGGAAPHSQRSPTSPSMNAEAWARRTKPSRVRATFSAERDASRRTSRGEPEVERAAHSSNSSREWSRWVTTRTVAVSARWVSIGASTSSRRIGPAAPGPICTISAQALGLCGGYRPARTSQPAHDEAAARRRLGRWPPRGPGQGGSHLNLAIMSLMPGIVSSCRQMGGLEILNRDPLEAPSEDCEIVHFHTWAGRRRGIALCPMTISWMPFDHIGRRHRVRRPRVCQICRPEPWEGRKRKL